MIAIDYYIQKKYEQQRIRRENARRANQLHNEKRNMLAAERETRLYNKLKAKADKKAAVATARAEKKAAIIARKAAIATAKEAKKAAKKAAKEVRNNEYYLSKLMGFGRLNM